MKWLQKKLPEKRFTPAAGAFTADKKMAGIFPPFASNADILQVET